MRLADRCPLLPAWWRPSPSFSLSPRSPVGESTHQQGTNMLPCSTKGERMVFSTTLREARKHNKIRKKSVPAVKPEARRMHYVAEGWQSLFVRLAALARREIGCQRREHQAPWLWFPATETGRGAREGGRADGRLTDRRVGRASQASPQGAEPSSLPADACALLDRHHCGGKWRKRHAVITCMVQCPRPAVHPVGRELHATCPRFWGMIRHVAQS